MLEDEDTSVRSTLDLGSRTLSIMRQFVADVADDEKDSEKGADASVPELNVKGSHQVKDTRTRHPTLHKDTIMALRKLIEEFEDQLQCSNEGCEDTTSDEGQEEVPLLEATVNVNTLVQNDEENDEVPLPKEPQLYLGDDWIQPMAAMSKPRNLTAREKMRANVAKNCLIVTLMSLEVGYGPILERYRQEGESIAQCYEQSLSDSRPTLNSVHLSDEEYLARRDELLQIDAPLQAAVAAMPPPTRLSLLNSEIAIHSVGSQGAKDAVKSANLKMYHVMSVKQTLREDLAEHAYQFSCRAADWSRSDFSSVPMRFEPLELHVVDALGQQGVPDYFQQPAKAITEDVNVMRGPDALEWIRAVQEEIESFKRLGVYEEVPRGKATSTPLPARLILVTKPNVHGGPARKKARIVICGNFQEVHPDEFTASKTPSYPSLRIALSVASHLGWPIECWDVATAFLYARLFGDRDTDLGGE